MRRLSSAAALTGLALAAAACGAGDSGQSPATSALVPIGAGLKGPEGLVATVYARGMRRMSAFAFDERGRLWVATSGLTSHARDAVYVVRGANEPPKRVITGLRGPLGLLWYRSRLYVASLGRVTMFGRLRGARFTTRRTVVDGRSAAARTTASRSRRTDGS